MMQASIKENIIMGNTYDKISLKNYQWSSKLINSLDDKLIDEGFNQLDKLRK